MRLLFFSPKFYEIMQVSKVHYVTLDGQLTQAEDS